jgi:ubiquinone/menaquinone biosynthesis C-methylase UbiE
MTINISDFFKKRADIILGILVFKQYVTFYIMNSQVSAWEEASAKIDIENLKQYLKSFSITDSKRTYHHHLLDEINRYVQPGKRVIEVGGQLGGNVFLVDDRAEKYLLDLDKTAIDRAGQLFEELGKKANFVHADMFDMPFPEKHFDIVFNSGVLEHFSQQERSGALREYARVLKDDGVMILAIPNHYSFWYRAYYIFANCIGKWKIPKEFKILDMLPEIQENHLVLLERKVVCPEPIFFFW